MAKFAIVQFWKGGPQWILLRAGQAPAPQDPPGRSPDGGRAVTAIGVYQRVTKVLESLRETHAGEWHCGNPSHRNPDAICPECLLYCASCDVEMPCPTVRMLDKAEASALELLDRIEADVKGGE